MSREKRIRKARMQRNKRRRFEKAIARMEKVARNMKFDALVRCFVLGHDYRDNVPGYTEPICLRCGCKKSELIFTNS